MRLTASSSSEKVLRLKTLRPWDLHLNLDGKRLSPFQGEKQLLDKTKILLNRLDPRFADHLRWLYDHHLLDLSSRPGKASGGYNYPLPVTGVSFIFMNAVGLHQDVQTLLHEFGHALHTLATNRLEILPYRDPPSEIAELASMGMELLSMEEWDVFYRDKADLVKAKREKLEGIIKFLPWCMIVDALQQWIYTLPTQPNKNEIGEYFTDLLKRFQPDVDWSGLESVQADYWHRQIHIFQHPFYYIEYGIAQLGAVALYRNFKKDRKKTLSDYWKALQRGGSASLGEIYETAGITLKFSKDYLLELMTFINTELQKLEASV